MNRRAALKVIGSATAAALLEGCARRAAHVAGVSPAPDLIKLSRVEVRPELEIRTVVGLRPFRPSGFVVRSEKLGDKLIVHNYGHGGGGVSLSWGTGELATRIVRDAQPQAGTQRVAVLGSGAVGLATARLLQERGYEVTIYAKDLPPNTTSNIAGAQWYPFLISDSDRRTPEFLRQLVEAARIAHRRFQLMVGDRYGVRWMPNYYAQSEPFDPNGRFGAGNPLREFLVDLTAIKGAANPFPSPFVERAQQMMIEPSVYLPAVMDDFHIAGGRIVVQEFHSTAEIASLPESAIVNCTGLGARSLFADQELTPVKGQLTVLLPQPQVNYAALFGDYYMFPRRDGILLGGTHEHDVWTLDPNLEAKQRIISEHQKFFSGMKV